MGEPEKACTFANGGLISSGGGFSNFWARPLYQNRSVEKFLSTSDSLPPISLFNISGRAYPDVALIGHNYPILVGGKYYIQDGTSASTPVFAAMLTLINDARLNAGKPPIGFANPALYFIAMTNPDVFHDIGSGKNNCCAAVKNPVCCKYGFTAQNGFNPVTGLGSVNFGKLKDAFMNF